MLENDIFPEAVVKAPPEHPVPVQHPSQAEEPVRICQRERRQTLLDVGLSNGHLKCYLKFPRLTTIQLFVLLVLDFCPLLEGDSVSLVSSFEVMVTKLGAVAKCDFF